MKVLYVSYDGMTDALGRSQVIPYLLKLSSLGYQIYVLSCEKKEIPEPETKEVESLFLQHRIQWSPLSFSTRPPWVSKVMDVVKIKKQAQALHQKHNFDIVHCRSYIAALAGLQLKRKYGVRFVFDMRGFWVDERVEGDIWNLKNPIFKYIFRYFKKKEKQFFQYADAVVSLTHSGKQVIADMLGSRAAEKTTVIPCCVDTTLFSHTSLNGSELSGLKSELGIGANDFVISYLGSVGTWYMLDEMFVFFKKLQGIYPQVRFLFISGDNKKYILQKAAAHGILAGQIIIRKASRDQVPLFLALSDVSLFFIKPVFSKKASSPTKQAEIMSMGIPLICNAGVGDTQMLFADEKVGLVLKDFTEKEYDRALKQIERVRRIDPEVIRNRALQYFNLHDGVVRYDQIYKQITGAEK